MDVKQHWALLAAAVAGLLGTFSHGSVHAQEHGGMAMGDGVPCYGINKCQGTGDCGGAGHSCHGQNACQGQGQITLSEDDCLRIEGGRLTAEAELEE